MLRTQTRNLMAILHSLVLMLLLALSTSATAATLEWDPNPEANVIGYRVYYGVNSRLYDVVVDVGNVTSFTITNLPGITTYFAITAYDSDGLESDYSEEVFYTRRQVAIAIAITRTAILISPEETEGTAFGVYTSAEVEGPYALLLVTSERTIPITTGADPRRFFKVFRR